MTCCNGGFTFAEHPERAAPDARIIWHADFDPGTLHVDVVPADDRTVERIDLAILRPWLTSVVGSDGLEHAVLSDGWHRIRLDMDHGSLSADRPVALRYHLHGMAHAQAPLLALRRLIHLYRHRRFAASLFPRDTRIDRWLDVLRVHDAMSAGASQRDIADRLFGIDRVREDWGAGSDSLRHRVIRLASEARRFARGGYRLILGSLPPPHER